VVFQIQQHRIGRLTGLEKPETQPVPGLPAFLERHTVGAVGTKDVMMRGQIIGQIRPEQ
jgi:hypothetical protein